MPSPPPPAFTGATPNQTPIPDYIATITSQTPPQFLGGPAVADNGFQLPAVDGDFSITSQTDGAAVLWNNTDFGNNVWDLDQRTEFNSGVIVTPVAGPPGTAPDMIVVHAGYYSKVAAFSAETQGRKPTLPSSNTQNVNDVLVYSSITSAAPIVGPDGINPVYRVSGMYAYAIAVALNPFTPIQSGALPYLTLQTTDTAIVPGEFNANILYTPSY